MLIKIIFKLSNLKIMNLTVLITQRQILPTPSSRISNSKNNFPPSKSSYKTPNKVVEKFKPSFPYPSRIFLF